MEPRCPKCGGRMEYHKGEGLCQHTGPHWYCLSANCGTNVFPKWGVAEKVKE